MFRILLVEDNLPYRESLRDIIDGGKFSGVIVEEAGDAKGAMEKVDSFCPDLIFMDIGLPDGSGLELTNRIKIKWPPVCVAILTSLAGPEYHEAAVRYGANHFLTKGNATREEIQNLVKSSLSEK